MDACQNLTRNVVWRERMGLAVAGRPNWALLMLTIHAGYVTWFRALVASKRRSAFQRSPSRKVRDMDAFMVNCEGPVMEFRPALPHWPGSGTRTAAGLRNRPCGGA